MHNRLVIYKSILKL